MNKFCKDCKYFDDDWGSSCDHPGLKTIDPVSGPVSSYPSANRKEDGKCGPDGLYFEDKISLWQKIVMAMSSILRRPVQVL